jgi:hypothetical protein
MASEPMSRTRASTKAVRHLLEYLIIFIVLAVMILLVVHPWIRHFTTGFPEHFDPPNHTMHLCWNAESILRGHVWAPDYNCNFFYPHAYTFAFDEPVWFPSLFAAIVYGLSRDPVLVWNATALFVWALSGVTMYAFLRELPVSRGAAYFGAAAFCLIPYRLAYYVELNMIFCFAIPLVYLFFIRWLRRPGYRNALWLALALTVSATTHLYYTIITLVPMPFILIGFLVRRPQMLRQRRFYLSAAFAILVAAGLSAPILYPYAHLRWHAHYARTVQQQARCSVQPLTYLRPSPASLVHRVSPKANAGETVIFAGYTLSALACAYWVHRRLAFRKWHNTPLAARTRQALALARGTLWFVFALLIFYGAYHSFTSSFASVKFLIVPSIILVFCTSVVLLFMPFDRDVTHNRAVLSGLAVGAIACFMLSFGPVVTVGCGHDTVPVGKGPMAYLYQIIPFFSLMRVVTRFALIVLLYMIAAACAVLDAALRKRPRLRWLWLVVLALVLVETYSRPYRFADQQQRRASPVQHMLQEMPEPVSVVVIPFGAREFDGPAMMDIVGKWNYLINGWAGFMPKQHRRLGYSFAPGKMDQAADWLRQIWPEAYLVVDLKGVRWWRRNFRSKFTQRDLRPYWRRMKRDELFVLYRLCPLKDTPPRVVRRLRTDVLRHHPVLRFEARALDVPDGATPRVRIRVNGAELAELELTAELKPYEVTIPRHMTGNIFGEEVSLTIEFAYPDRTEHPDAPGLWELRNVDFTAN